MSRKLIAIVVLTVLVITTPVLLYFHFRPSNVSLANYDAQNLDLFSEVVTYEAMSDYIKNVSTRENSEILSFSSNDVYKFIIFIGNNDGTSNYIANSLIKPLSIETDTKLPDIIKVDTTNTKNLTVTQLKNNFNIEVIPAFIYVEQTNGVCNIVDTLVYREDEPLTKDTLKNWLYHNGLWDTPIE